MECLTKINEVSYRYPPAVNQLALTIYAFTMFPFSHSHSFELKDVASFSKARMNIFVLAQ